MRKRAIAQIIACSIIASILTFILIGCTATGITSSIVHDTVDAIGDPIKKTVEITEKAVSHLPTPRIRLFGCAPIITIDDNDLVIGDSTGSVPSGYSEGDAAYDTVPTTLDIDWASGRIYIDVRADAQGVRLYECAGSVTPDLAAAEAPNDVADPNRMIHRFQNDTLKIEQFRHGITWVGVHETYQKTLVVILPETTLDKLNIDAAAVEIFLNGCKADRLDLDTAAGKVNAVGCTFDRAEIDSASTELNMTDSKINRIDLDVASGKTFLDLVNTPEKVDVDSASASITMRLPADAAFTVKINSISGRSDIDGAFGSLSVQNGTTVVNGGGATFDFDMMSGNVTIQAKTDAATPSETITSGEGSSF